MRSSTTGRIGELPLIPQNSGNTSQVNTSNLTYETSNRKLKMNTNNRTNSRNTNSRSGYLDFNDHYLDHYSSNDHHLPHQYQYNNYLNNDNLAVDRIDYLNNSNNVYGHHSLHPLNVSQGRQLQEDDCKSIHQYEEPMNLIRPMPNNFTSLKNNGLLNSLSRKYSDLQLNHLNQLNNQQQDLHLEMASRKENSENSDESVLSMESDMSDKRNLMRKNGATSSSSGSNNGQSSHVYNGRNIANTSSRKYKADGKDHHFSELPNSSDCSLSKVDTVSSTVPGSSTATLEADARFMNLISSANGSKYNKNTSIINYDNERIYGLSNSKLSNNPLDSLNYGSAMTEENIYNNGSAASTTSASNVLLKTGNGNNLLNDLRNKSATLQSTANVNQLSLFKHESGTTGPLISSQNTTTNLLASQLLDQTGTVYHTALHSNFSQPNQGFKMLNSRFSFNLTKSCNSNQPCYWRLASLVLILICLIMVALFAYKQATSTSLLFNDESNKPCILVDDYSTSNGMPVFPPPQFLPKQQIQSNLPSSYSATGPVSSPSTNANSANPSTNYHSSPNSPNNAHSIHLPTDPSIYKEIQFNLINSDYSSASSSNNNLNSQTAYLIEPISFNSVISGSIHQQSGGLIRFRLKQLPISARLAFLARRNEPPTLTNHELIEFITADGSTAHEKASRRRSSRSIFEQIIFRDTLNSYLSENELYPLQTNRIKRSSLNSLPSSGSTVSIEYLEYFEPGHWFFVFINDANHELQYTLHLNITKLTSAQYPCPSDCNGHGLCEQGKCNCDTGFVGSDCSRNVCPVLCSGNGQYIRGSCKCDPRYFGVECESKRTSTCAQNETPCSGHGLCVAGQCVCNKNYLGDDCEQQIIDSSSGTCKPIVSSSIRESELIKATNQKQKELEICLAHCLNGRCNDKGKCICSPGYTGRFCTLSSCVNNCSSHGQCLPIKLDQSITNIVAGEDDLEGESIEYECSCSADWTGPDCSFRFERNCADDLDNDNDGLIDCADSECCSKDECKDSLMCLTSPDPLDIVLRKPAPSISASFYQKTKFLIEEGSVQSYAHRDEYSESRVSVIRGKIVTPDGNGLTGIRISVATDSQFGFTLTRADGWFDILVNGGSMVSLQFQRSPFHPIKHSVYVAWNEIVVMQSPIIMNVVANADDAQQHNQSGSQHSTIYNQHLSKNVNQSNYLHQQQYTLETVFWPYTSKSSNHLRNKSPNDKQGRNSHRQTVSNSSAFSLHCWSHDYRMQPLIINRQSKLSKQGNLFDQSLITLEDRSLSESYKIAVSNLQLVYQSSSSPAYLSVIELQLTPDKIPHDLLLVHLRIVIEGNLFSKELEAKPSLSYSYAWNKRNVYKQKVYGVTTAKIYVGYEYEHCQHIIWSTLSTKMNGFQIDVSEFAGWNLQIHHRLNLNDKIIQLGSGGTIDLQQDVYLKETFGRYGQQRKESDCLNSKSTDCLNNNNLLKQPVSLTSGSDGSLYIGDADLIRRLRPDGSSMVLFKFPSKQSNGQLKKSNQASYVYSLQYSAYDNHLYVTDSERFQIFKLLNLDNVDNVETNFEVIAGNGLRCFHAEDVDQCGDGSLAVEARLSQPKAIVFSADNSMYFADGTSVRRINRKGVIYTIVSANLNNHKLRPFNCDYLHDSAHDLWRQNLVHTTARLSARKIKLNWPTQLAINPLNNLLYILDEGHVIYELTADHRMKVVVGKPVHCSNINDLGLITSFAFTSTGDMYISIISNGLHQIKLRTTDGSIQHYLGEQVGEKTASDLEEEQHHFEENYLHRGDLKGNSFSTYYDQQLSAHLNECLSRLDSDECQAYVNYDLINQNKSIRTRKLAKQFKINVITVTGDNLVHIMDSENYQILSLKSSLEDNKQQHFNVLNSLTEELYLFNKHGLHLATLNALTGRTIYTFTYDQNTSIGKLISVGDGSNNKITFVRQQGKLSSIVTSNGQKCRVNVNAKGQLEQIVEEDGLKTSYEYDANNLLISKSDNLGLNYYFEYDRFGRLVSVIKPSGVRVNVNYRPNVEGASISTNEISLIDQRETNKLQLQFKPNGQRLFTSKFELSLADLTNSNYLISNAFNQTVHLSRVPAQELIIFQSANSAIQSNAFRQNIYTRLPTGEMKRTQIAWDIDIKYKDAWRAAESFDEVVAVERALNIEGNRILSIEYDRTANREIMYNNSRRPFLMIQYDNSSRPIQWLNTETRLPLNVIYDRQGRLAGWQQGSKMSETFVYDRNGLLIEIKYPDLSSIKYLYGNEEERKHPSIEQLPANLKPTKIILRSGKEFYYKYDQRAGLQEIWTPKSSVKHQFKFIISLGFYKLHYAAPGFDFSTGYIVYFDDQMKPIMEHHSKSRSKVLYKYNQQNGQLSEIVYGSGKVVHTYESDEMNRQLLMNEYWLEGEDQVLISYAYKYSRLPSSQHIQFNTMYKLFDFRLQYEYDSFSRKISIISSITSNQQSSNTHSLNYLYNDKTGKLEQFGNFKIIDHHDYLRKQNESLISDGTATFSKIYDSINHKLKQFLLIIRDKEVYRTIYTLNANNAIVSKKRFVKLNGQQNLRTSQTNFTYDLDEQLIEMRSEREHWRFNYDDNFNLIRIQYLQNAIEITIDHAKDRISNFGDTPYVYDEQGLLVRRGEELFTYNAFNLLVSISKLNKQHEINYLYDSKGRLSARIDNFGNRTQYFYGDIKRPQLLTNLVQFNVERSSNEQHSSSRPLITNYIYDDSNLLIAFTTNVHNLNAPNEAANEATKLFYVVCDQSGSPTHVFNSQTGELVKEITRSPFGHILFDSNPSIYLPVGFHGSLSEPLISVVFFGRFVYDTLVGQFLQPNYGQIFNAGLIEPKYLTLYRYARNDPINFDLYSLTRTDRYDLNKWIQHNGIDLSGFDLELSRFINQNDQHFSKLITNVEDVVYNYRKSGVQRKQTPTFNYGSSEQFDAMSHTVDMIANAIPLPNIALNSDFLSTLTLNSMNFAKISFIKKSQLKSDQLLEPSKIERLHTEQILGEGLSLSRKRNGNLYVTCALDADQMKYSVYSKVLNDSGFINLQQNKAGKDLFYFVKQDTVSVSEDLSELQKLGHSVNITINEVKSDQSESDIKSKVDIRIETMTAIMNIRYGSTLKEERQRLFAAIKEQTIKAKWRQAQQLLINLKQTQDQFSTIHTLRTRLGTRWTEKEKEQIIMTGELAGYTGEYYHNVKHYPELADDPNNIRLIKF